MGYTAAHSLGANLSIWDMNQKSKKGRFARSAAGRPVTDGKPPAFRTRFARDAWWVTADAVGQTREKKEGAHTTISEG